MLECRLYATQLHTDDFGTVNESETKDIEVLITNY